MSKTTVLGLILLFAVSLVGTGFILGPAAGRADNSNVTHPPPRVPQQSGNKASASLTRSAVNSSTATNATSLDPPCPPTVSLSTCGNLTFSQVRLNQDGGVMRNAINYLIFWLPSGTNPVSNGPYTYDNSTIDLKATNPSDTKYENLIIRYFHDVCGSAFYSTLNQYPAFYGTLDQTPTGRCSFGASWVDTSAFPGKRGTLTHPLIQDDMINEVEHARKVNGWDIGEVTNEFFIFTPFDVYDCNTANIIFTFYAGCEPDLNNPGSLINIPHCAYHYFYQVGFLGTGPPVIFGVVPDAGTALSGKTTIAAGGCGNQLGPNSDQFADLTINQASHEQFESVTDPLGDGWYFGDHGHENGDQCAYDFLGVEPDGSNVKLNGNPYLVQAEWDNTNSGCDMDTAGPPVGVSVTLSPSFGFFGCCSPPDTSEATSFVIRFQEAGETSSASTAPLSRCSSSAPNCDLISDTVSVSATPGTTVTVFMVEIGEEQWCVSNNLLTQPCPSVTLQSPTTGSLSQRFIYYDLLGQTASKQFTPIPTGSLLGSLIDCPLTYTTAPSSPGPTIQVATIQVGLTSNAIPILPMRDSVASICDSVINQPTVRWTTPVATWNIGAPGQIGQIVYWGQYPQTVSYSLVGGGTSISPVILYQSLDKIQLTSLSTSAQTLWMNIGQTAQLLSTRLFGSNVGESWVEIDAFASTAQCDPTSVTGCFPSWVINSPNAIPSVLLYLHQATTQTAVSNGAASVDQSTLTGVSVGITGSAAADGTAISVTSTVLDSQPGGTAQLSVDGVGFLDVKIKGITDGTARVCVTDPNIAPQATMQYWDGASWVSAGNVVVTGTMICGDIPVSALQGTPIVLAVPLPGITASPAAATGLVGNAHTVTATVTTFVGGATFDNVTFIVTGANPTGPTDVLIDPSTGQANFTYTGNNPGTDTITVTVSDRGFTVTATATETWVTVTLELSPSNATNPVGTDDTVTATLTDPNGFPVYTNVTFTVTGANPAGPTVVATDPATGNADFTYTGNSAGTDTITAITVTPEGVTLTSTVTKTWVLGFLDLSPPDATNPVGTNHTITATLTDLTGLPLAGVTVYFTVQGANTFTGRAVTDANGQAFFTYTGTNFGTDTITATAQIGGPTVTGSATKTWE